MLSPVNLHEGEVVEQYECIAARSQLPCGGFCYSISMITADAKKAIAFIKTHDHELYPIVRVTALIRNESISAYSHKIRYRYQNVFNENNE